jgi:transposase InsO family protein
VHQGDQDKKKGVYHINLVDEITQFEITFAVEKISESYLLPGLQAAMEELPFKIRGFHSDNGSEFINKNVAELLNKMNIEFTKSRSRQSNDNALVESKNASVIRKHFGYSHIPQHWAEEINRQIQEPLYRYQNFHRPCFYPTTTVDEKGKERKLYLYDNLMTPFEKLKSIVNYECYLKDGITAAELERYAKHCTDTEAAEQLKLAKQNLFANIIRASA